MNQPTDQTLPPQDVLPEPYASMERLKPTTPWVSYLLLGVTIALFICYKIPSQPLGAPPYGARDIWYHNQFWQILTNAFVHLDPFHMAMNCYVFYLLAPLMERQLGPLLFILFIIASDLVSSSSQLAWGDSGIGLSGIIYGFIGYMIVLRRRYLEFALIMHPGNVKLFIGWLFICILITWLDLLPIANTAHFTGFIFGIALGAVAINRKRILWAAIASVMLLLSLVPPFFAPWASNYLYFKAGRAYEQRDFQEAVSLFTRFLEREPQDARALYFRGNAYLQLGQIEKGRQDRNAALKLDPDLIKEPASSPHSSSDQTLNP